MAAKQTLSPFPSRDARLSPRCLGSSPLAAATATSVDGSSPLALSTMSGGMAYNYCAADSSFSAASSSRGHSPFGKSNHSRQSSLISSSSANSSFHGTVNSAHNGSGRHFRQRSEPLLLEHPPMPFHHSRQSSSTTSGDSLGARRKQRQYELSWDRIQGFPKEQPQRPSVNFLLGTAPKMMSSPTSIDMGYHTLNGDNSLSLEPYDTSLNGINLACPSVRYNIQC